MPEPLTCWDKVEDALAAVIAVGTAPGEPMEGWTVNASPSSAVAVTEDEKAIRIYTVGIAMEQFDELGQTIHTQTLEIEFSHGNSPAGTISRIHRRMVAYAHALIAADRELGGRLLDIQEIDVAPAQTGGKDAGSTSIQYQAQFFTARDDFFTILGQPTGTTF